MKSSNVPLSLQNAYESHSDNLKCFDCNSPHPTWTSFSLGIYLCINCCGKHRSLGSHISKVKSLLLDNWRNYEIAFMEFGGNHMAHGYLGHLKHLPYSELYNSPEAEGLRIWLESQVRSKCHLPWESKVQIVDNEQNQILASNTLLLSPSLSDNAPPLDYDKQYYALATSISSQQLIVNQVPVDATYKNDHDRIDSRKKKRCQCSIT